MRTPGSYLEKIGGYPDTDSRVQYAMNHIVNTNIGCGTYQYCSLNAALKAIEEGDETIRCNRPTYSSIVYFWFEYDGAE